MVRKWLVSGVHFGAEVDDVQRKKITAEPILSLDTSPMASGQHLCLPSALSSLFGEDSEAVLLDIAQEPEATVYTHTGMCWHEFDIYLFCHSLCLLVLMFLISWWISSALLPIVLLTSQLFSSCFLFHVLLVTSASFLDSPCFLFQLLPLLLASTRAPCSALLPTLSS